MYKVDLESQELTEYLQFIKSIPLLSREETTELFKNFTQEARKKLIESNLRLVVSIANDEMKRRTDLVHIKLMDAIQEGNVGLIEAIDNYDIENGASLSTYATSYISGKIRQMIRDREQLIRKPDGLQYIMRDYLKLVADYKSQNRPLPDKKTICKLLKINEKTLDNVLITLRQEVFSLNKVIYDDDDTYTIEDVVSDKNLEYIKTIDDMADFELLITLKKILKPAYYYVLYSKFLGDEARTSRSVASSLGVRDEGVRQIKNRVLKQLKNYILSSKIEREQKKIKRTSRDYYRLKVAPISPEEIALYYYIEEYLTIREQSVMKLILFGDYNYSLKELADLNDMSLSEFNEFYRTLQNKVYDLLKDREKFDAYKKELLSIHKTKIYNLIKK